TQEIAQEVAQEVAQEITYEITQEITQEIVQETTQEITQGITKRMCGHCYINKTIEHFYHSGNDNTMFQSNTFTSDEPGITTSSDFNTVVSSGSSNIIFDNHYSDMPTDPITIASDFSNITAENFDSITSNNLNTIISSDSGSIINNEGEHDDQNNNNLEVLIYDLDEVHEIIAKKFEEAEIFSEPIKFILKVELYQDLLDEFSLDQQNLASTTDLKLIEMRFRQLASLLTIPLESGFGYYWEIRKIYLNSKNKKFSGLATAYLGCTMQDD
ncbi:5461_t:CDS:2, partial [Racocetra fulgida]